MDLIYKNIYISSYELANDPRYIEKYKIKYVLSLVDLPFKETVLENIQERKIIALPDLPWEPFPFTEVNEILDKWACEKKDILVHCYAGISRAVTAVAGFMIYKSSGDVKKILEFIKDKRPKACPNYGFVIQLYSYKPKISSSLSSEMNL